MFTVHSRGVFPQDKSDYFSNSKVCRKNGTGKVFTIKGCSLIRGVHYERFHCIASTMIKLISKNVYCPFHQFYLKYFQRIVADPKRKLSPPFDSADSVPSLSHPAPGSGKTLSLFTVLCEYPVWVTETGAPSSGKTIQPIRI